MVGEVQSLLNEVIEVHRPTLAGDPARVLQHALDDAIGSPAVLCNFYKVPIQRIDDLFELAALVGIDSGQRGRRGLFQLVQ